MAGFSYLLPIVGLGPPPGYRIGYSLPIEPIARLLTTREGVLRATHRVFRDGAAVQESGLDIAVVDGRPSRPSWVVTLEDDGKSDWRAGEHLSYWELALAADAPAAFVTNQPVASYSLFDGPMRKTFFNDNAIKFGDPVTIQQVRELEAWCAGYPCCGVDVERDADESVVLVNPYHRPALMSIELANHPRLEKVRVEPMTARRISIAGLLGTSVRAWRGQVYVTGPNRLIVFFAKHGLANPCEITTLEHPDLYRGEPTHEALTQRLRRWAGNHVRSLRA